MTVSLALSCLQKKQNLSADQTREVFDAIFEGNVPKPDIAALLLGLKEKGETTEEILGAVRAMREKMTPLPLPETLRDQAIDIVGTGGDHHGTFNVSTATAFVVAACGVPVAKHGNRAATSKSGSSDVLRALGVQLEPSWDVLTRSLQEVGIVFLFAPRHHAAMRHVAEVRRELGVRTIFNLLGPLTNPAGVKKHLIGVFDPARMQQMAEVLQTLGSHAAWFSHGSDGMDEITTTGATDIVAFDPSAPHLRRFQVTPEDIGAPRAMLDDLRGDMPEANAMAIRDLFDGKKGAFRDIVTLNAAAALVVAGKALELETAAAMARLALDTGVAREKLHAYAALTQETA